MHFAFTDEQAMIAETVRGFFAESATSQATRVIIENNRATGVEFQSPKGREIARARRYWRASAGAAGQCFARAAFVHAQPDVRAVDDLHKARVDAFGKPWMRLDHRAFLRHWRHVGIRHHLHGVRISNG